MNKSSKTKPRLTAGVYSILMLVFAAATYVFTQRQILAASEAFAAIVLFVVDRVLDRRAQRELKKYIETVTYETEEAKNSTVMNFPLPMATYMLDSGRVVWANQEFFSICGQARPQVGAYMADLIPAFDGKWILEGKRRCPNLMQVGERRYQVHGNLIRSDKAHLITCADDLITFMGWKTKNATAQPVQTALVGLLADLSPTQQTLLDKLQEAEEGLNINFLVMETDLPYETVASEMLMLELQGLVRSLPGGIYRFQR